MGTHIRKVRKKLPAVKMQGRLRVLFGDESAFNVSDALVFAVLTVLLLLVSLFELNKWSAIAIYGLLFVAAALQCAKNAFYKLLNGEILSTDMTVLLASAVCFIAQGYTGAVTAALVYRACVLCYSFFYGKYEQTLGALADSIPGRVKLEEDGEIREVSPRGVNVGDIIVVDNGEVIPLDGIVISGMTSVSMDKLGGNSSEIPIAKNSFVCAGCVNEGKQIRIKTTAVYTEVYAAKLTDVISHAYLSPSGQERMAFTANRYFPAFVFLIALLYFVGAGVRSDDVLGCLARASAVMALGTTACVGLSVPLAYICCVANLSKGGVIVKKNCYVQDLAETQTAVFGKNGVMTDGKYLVYDVLAEEGIDPNKLLGIAVTSFVRSKATLASALRASAKNADMSINSSFVEVIEEQINRGINVNIGKTDVFVGIPAYIREKGFNIRIYDKPGMQILCVVVDGRYCGQITMADKMRPGAFEMVDTLHVVGVSNVVMLTSESARIATQTANSLNFDMVKYELDDEGKLDALKFLLKNKNNDTALAYIGYFRDDAELMKEADVGISIKSFGAEQSLELSDVCVLGDDIAKIGTTISACKACKTIALMNLAASSAAKLLLIILALCGAISMGTAAIADGVLFMLAIYNSSRELRDFGKK